MQVIIERLKTLIKGSGKTQIQICKDLGISKQKLTNWKSGYSSPTLEDVVMLARYFGVSSDYLLGIENEDGANAEE